MKSSASEPGLTVMPVRCEMTVSKEIKSRLVELFIVIFFNFNQLTDAFSRDIG